MILKPIQVSTLKIKIYPLFFVTMMSFSLMSCSTVNNNHSKTSVVFDSVAQAIAIYCSSDSHNVTLDLSKVKLTRVQNMPLIYQGYNNIEGPLWHNGALYYSNMGSHLKDENGFELTHQGTIWRWVPGEEPSVWLKDSHAGTNGLAINSKGQLIVGRQLDGSISSIDWESKTVNPIATTYKGKRFNSPNDLTISHDDIIYFTDPNWNTPSNVDSASIQGGGQPGSIKSGQRIYRVTAGGVVTSTNATELVPALRDKPNGIMLSLDQQQLIIGGLQGLWVFNVNSTELANPKRLLNTPIDGLAKDCSGNIYVTTTRELPERKDGQVIVVLNKDYQEIGMINVPSIHIVTNVAFGGEDGKTLFVTSLTAPMDGKRQRLCGNSPCLPAGIYSTRLNVQGFPY